MLLGIGGLSKKQLAYKTDYLKNTVLAVKAKTVIPIHWDRMDMPFGPPLIPGEKTSTIDYLIETLPQHKIQFHLIPAWQKIPVFEAISDSHKLIKGTS